MKPGPVLKKSRKNNPFEKYSVHNYENLSALFEEEQKKIAIFGDQQYVLSVIFTTVYDCV